MSSRFALLFLLFVTCYTTLCTCGRRRELSVRRDARGELELVDGWVDGALVNSGFNNTINTTGWSFLEIKGKGGSGALDDIAIAKAVGMAEGALTADLMLMHWKNTLAGFCITNTTVCYRLNLFIQDNQIFMLEMIAKYSESDPFWYQVQLFMAQLEGLLTGYLSVGLEPLTIEQLFLMQIAGDLDALQSALSDNEETEKEKVIGAGKCSALVKLLPGNAELFVSHDTWDDYHGMLRVYKLYDITFSTAGNVAAIIPGHRVSFSSYPGVLLSGDDFYQLSTKLVTTETTFGNSNPALWKFITPRSVMEGIRNVVANRLATSGDQWCTIFSQYNSGTYNNQWMVVDYKLFERGQSSLKDGLLWVLEQLPGSIHAEDKTDMLRSKSYWPSYNIPYYNDIYNESGFAAMEKKYGSWFSWNLSPRAQIFARNHTDVKDMNSMISLMRYNNFQYDPLSRCNCIPPYSGENAISARSDLNMDNGKYPFGALGRRCHGGTDNKVTSSAMMEDGMNLGSMATSGPTHRQQTPFRWSTAGYGPKPLGHPDKWEFEPVAISWGSS